MGGPSELQSWARHSQVASRLDPTQLVAGGSDRRTVRRGSSCQLAADVPAVMLTLAGRRGRHKTKTALTPSSLVDLATFLVEELLTVEAVAMAAATLVAVTTTLAAATITIPLAAATTLGARASASATPRRPSKKVAK